MSMIDEILRRHPSAPVQRVLDSLDRVQETSSGWIACCPCHDDSTPSLSISEGDDGRVLLYCHAGCPLDFLLEGLSLEPRDLFARRTRRRSGGLR